MGIPYSRNMSAVLRPVSLCRFHMSGGAIVSDGSEAASSVPKWLWAVVALGLLLAAAAAVLVVLRRRQRKNKGEDGHA